MVRHKKHGRSEIEIMFTSDLQKTAIYRAFLICAHKKAEGRKDKVGRSEGPPIRGGTSSDLPSMTCTAERWCKK